MELLLGAAIVALFVRTVATGVSDAFYAWRGKDHPRFRARAARAQANGRSATPRYGTGDYVADLWSDFLAHSTKARRERYEQKEAQGRKPRWPALKPAVERLVRPVGEPAPEPPPAPVAPEPPAATGPVCEHCGAALTGPRNLHPDGRPVCPTTGQLYPPLPARPRKGVVHDDNGYYTPRPGSFGFCCRVCGHDSGNRYGTEAEAQTEARGHVCPGPAPSANEPTKELPTIEPTGGPMTTPIADDATTYEGASAALGQATAATESLTERAGEAGRSAAAVGDRMDEIDAERARLAAAIDQAAAAMAAKKVDPSVLDPCRAALDAVSPQHIAAAQQAAEELRAAVGRMGAALDEATGALGTAKRALDGRYGDVQDQVGATHGSFINGQ